MRLDHGATDNAVMPTYTGSQEKIVRGRTVLQNHRISKSHPLGGSRRSLLQKEIKIGAFEHSRTEGREDRKP
jgi:hypothetical protein